MGWIRQLLRLGERSQTPGQEAASSALARVEARREEAGRRAPEVAEQGAEMRRLRERNHFQEAIRATFLGGGS